jgi:hypothetical protein
MCKLADISYAPKHFGPDTAKTISILAEKVGGSHLYSKEKILQTMPIIMSYSDDLRIISLYGLEQENIPSIFSRIYAESVLEDAGSLCDFLRRMEMRIRWSL